MRCKLEFREGVARHRYVCMQPLLASCYACFFARGSLHLMCEEVCAPTGLGCGWLRRKPNKRCVDWLKWSRCAHAVVPHIHMCRRYPCRNLCCHTINWFHQRQPAPQTHNCWSHLPGKSKCVNDLLKAAMSVGSIPSAAPEDAEDADQVCC
jgi:hypothetical protein